MTGERQSSKLGSLWPLAFAGLFMLVGILVLVYLGRDTARLMNAPLDEIDIHALLNADTNPTAQSLQGKIAIFHFWGTWCGPCRQEFPEFVEVYQGYADNPQVEFISVSCSPGIENDLESLKNDTSDYLQSLDVKMPTYADPAMFTRSVITRMLASGGFGYPLTIVTDRQGIVCEYWLGAKPGAMKQLAKVIDRLLE